MCDFQNFDLKLVWFSIFINQVNLPVFVLISIFDLFDWFQLYSISNVIRMHVFPSFVYLLVNLFFLLFITGILDTNDPHNENKIETLFIIKINIQLNRVYSLTFKLTLVILLLLWFYIESLFWILTYTLLSRGGQGLKFTRKKMAPSTKCWGWIE